MSDPRSSLWFLEAPARDLPKISPNPKKDSKISGKPAEEIFEVGVVPETLKAARPGPDALVAELIVHLPALIVPEDLVGFGCLLELLLRTLVIGVSVRVILDRELTVGLLNLVLRCISIDAKDLIAISFIRHYTLSNPQ